LKGANGGFIVQSVADAIVGLPNRQIDPSGINTPPSRPRPRSEPRSVI
jgi:hypothetical protein